jgi:hypothetical protein
VAGKMNLHEWPDFEQALNAAAAEARLDKDVRR